MDQTLAQIVTFQALPDQVYDVVIIGSGGAGCAAAIEARRQTDRILVLTKGKRDDSKTAQAQGGIQAAIAEGDSSEQHFQDTLRTGGQAADPALVRILTSSARETIAWLEELGVEFDRKPNGEYLLQSGAGISQPRVLSVGDRAGRGIVTVLMGALERLAIPCLSETAVVSLVREEAGFHLALKSAEEERTIQAQAVVLASGGFTPREKAAGYADSSRTEMPDGLALAEGLNATIVCPELVQYHPTGVLEPSALRRVRLPETMRGAGAILRNKDGVAFADPLLTRNELTAAIVNECQSGRGVVTSDGRIGVWLDTTILDDTNGAGFTKSRFPSFHQMFLDQDHDLTRQPVLVYPVLHYSLGGVQISERAETSVPGLFAAGEVTWGVHGRERLMGNSLLDIFVFGRIAGRSAAQYALAHSHE